MMQAVLVGLTVFALEFIETWCSYPMTTRPLIVGTAIGIVLGDVATGVTVGASLELVFMGVMAIGGTVPPDACSGTAVGTAYAIILGQGVETAFTLAIPASILCQTLFVPLVALRSLWSPMIDKMVAKGDYKGLQRMMPVVSATMYVFQSPDLRRCGGAGFRCGSTVYRRSTGCLLRWHGRCGRNVGRGRIRAVVKDDVDQKAGGLLLRRIHSLVVSGSAADGDRDSGHPVRHRAVCRKQSQTNAIIR